MLEALALLQLVSLISNGLLSASDSENTQMILKAVFLFLTIVACGLSALLIYLLINAGLSWFAGVIGILGVICFYFMYTTEEGNVLDASLLLMSSMALIFFSTLEARLYTDNGLESALWLSPREEAREGCVASFLWIGLCHLSASLQLWLSIFHPLSVVHTLLRILFFVFYYQWKGSRNMYDQNGEASRSWSSFAYQTLPLLTITQMVCQHLHALKQASETSPEQWWGVDTQICYMRFAEAVLLQLIYVYSLCGTEAD
ncbi:uncharacterized protein [Watersipora subatra]|uniref:uncharacterized protein n=1 Tax=Watersipora subatra TaxID=2589382 RepID=UPI00355C901A